MGLLDILNGMQNGPRGPSNPERARHKGGMSPITMAILALLAYKAVKHLGGSSQADGAGASAGAHRATRSMPACPAAAWAAGLGDLLKGGLGGLLAGAAAGSVISGGLGDLLKQFQQNGQGEVANSWVGSRARTSRFRRAISAKALGADQINALTSQTGLSRDELLDGLSQQLPDVIDQLTPDGRLPTENELSGWI